MIRVISGIVLMVVAFIILFVSIDEPMHPLFAQVMAAINCKPGETFGSELGGYVSDSDGSRGRSVSFYCENSDKQRRDLSDGTNVILAMMGGFAVPFVVGLLLLISGSSGMKRRRMTRITNSLYGGMPYTGFSSTPQNVTGFTVDAQNPSVRSATVITMNGQQVGAADLPPETAQMINQLLGGLTATIGDANWMQAGNQGDLTEKLEQLKEALDKGLISAEEYDRLRKQILDTMS